MDRHIPTRYRLDSRAEPGAPSTWLAWALPALAAAAFLPGALDQFRLPKMLVLLVGLPVVLAAGLARGELRFPASRGERLLPGLAAAATLLSVAGPAVTARNLGLHLLGAAEAGLLLAVFLTAAALVRPGRPGTAAPLALPAGVTTAIAVMALLQAAGLDPVRELLSLHSSRPGRWQILTTTGNPGWTAELLAASFPLAAAWAWSRPGRSRHVLGFVLAGLFTAAVAVTGSRTGLLAAAVGAGVLVHAATGGGSRRRPWRTAAAATAVMGCGVLLALAAGSSRWEEVRPLTGRAALWSAGSRLVAVHPFLGSGLHHTGLVLPEGLREVVARVQPRAVHWLPTTLVDRLDNDWLQLTLERGLPAAALLFALWVLALRVSWRRALPQGSPMDAGAAGSLAAIGLCTLTSAPLHTTSTAILFWFLAGLAAGGEHPPAASTRPPSRARRLGLAAAVAAAAVAFLPAAGAIRLDLGAGRGHRLLRSGRAAEAVAPLRRAVRAMPWLERGAPDLADALERSGRPGDSLAACVESARWRASERVWSIEARALARLGEPAAARRVLAAGLAVLPRSPLLAGTWRELFPGRAMPAPPARPDPAMVRP